MLFEVVINGIQVHTHANAMMAILVMDLNVLISMSALTSYTNAMKILGWLSNLLKFELRSHAFTICRYD